MGRHSGTDIELRCYGTPGCFNVELASVLANNGGPELTYLASYVEVSLKGVGLRLELDATAWMPGRIQAR